MSFTRYTKADFDPYGDSRVDEPDQLWPAPTVSSPVDALVHVPGSKSLTNRELVLAAIADGVSLLRQPLHSDDSQHMVDALRALGVTIDDIPGDGMFGTDFRITPPDELTGSTTIECGLAGTVMRFVPPIAALAVGPTVFDAHPEARKRPMSTLITTLRQLGADIDDGSRGALPFTVHGPGRLAGGEVTIDASLSSQFVSALLLSAPRFDNGLHLQHEGANLPSMPHIDMTVQALAQRGVAVISTAPAQWTIEPTPINPRTVDIEPDLSNAAPFLAAAVVTGGHVRIAGWPTVTTQAGAQVPELMQLFGASVEETDDVLAVTGGESIRGIDVDLSEAGELVPTIAAVAALAHSPSRIRGIGHIRHHETDRLAALAQEINNLGGHVTVNDDGLDIEPRPLSGGTWESHNDHRMATAGAIIGLRVKNVQIHGIEATRKTLPEFAALWAKMIS